MDYVVVPFGSSTVGPVARERGLAQRHRGLDGTEVRIEIARAGPRSLRPAKNICAVIRMAADFRHERKESLTHPAHALRAPPAFPALVHPCPAALFTPRVRPPACNAMAPSSFPRRRRAAQADSSSSSGDDLRVQRARSSSRRSRPDRFRALAAPAGHRATLFTPPTSHPVARRRELDIRFGRTLTGTRQTLP